jgi:activating signal cointegrator complex subunit 3
MESFLQQVDSETKQPATSTFLDDNNNNNNNRLLLRRQQQALSSLAVSLQDVLPILSSLSLSTLQSDHHDSSSSSSVLPNVSAAWLVELCARVPSDLGADYLAHSILLQANQQQQHSDSSSCRMMMEQQQQLFDLLGDSEAAIDVAMQVFPRWKEIRAKIQKSDLLLEKEKRHKGDNGENNNDSEVILVNVQEEQRNYLLEQAREAVLLAELAKEQLAERRRQTSGLLTKGTATHFVTRTSDIQLEKQVAKLVKQAAQARQRAKDAGAILDDDDDDVFFKVDATSRGPGGLMKQSTLDLESLQQSLLPSGSKKYYDDKGLPQGTVFTTHEDYEKVVIPAALRNESQLPTRLQISDIMNATFAKAFEGTQSLNPMQSTVFSVAFHGRENVLLCAPTGAGKTNVAMLATVAHFRDVGLIQGSSDDDKESTTVLETGKKVVYIAPMKALAQEVVEKFSSKLKALKLIVRELTGDMQLTRAEAESANVIVTTPEKWDVITRKSGTDELSLGNQCGLLIIDEVHLLADERGAVIESVVSRLHRLVESRQRQLRIVALSATLPNYEDVAEFLQVPERGTFFFGPEHRPVPLEQTLIGISGNSRDRNVKETKMNKICYDIVLDSLRRGFQVMVFVHSRKGTSETARALADLAAAESTLESHFVTAGKDGAAGDAYSRYADKAKKSRDRQVGIHFQNGMGIHHAGMLRGDRKLTENMFTDGAIKVLCCTATLAWGVNLPAHSVIIKGTEVYNPEKGGTVDLSILDVQQIFGRAGRPQFDSFGEATLITNYDAYQRYIEKLVKAVPIESNFIKQLPDHLNAEIVGGTVTNITEAVQWLKYTYLYIRMLRNPLAYGINADEKFADPLLSSRCTELVVAAAKQLDETRMVRFHTGSQNLGATDKGRTAAHFYVRSESVATFTELMANIVPTDADLVRIIASASEFQSMKVRQEELDELEKIARSTPMEIKGAGLDDAGKGLITSATDKAFIMIQAYISRTKVNGFTLISDINYISANGGRIARALFEMCLKNKEAGPALKLLRIAKSIDNRTWWFQSPLRQFEGEIRENSLFKLEQSAGSNYDGLDYAVSLLDMQPKEVGDMCNWNQGGEKIQSYIMMLPRFDIEYQLLPITEGILKFRVNLTPAFRWHGRWHGNVQSFWIWIENTENERIYYHEQFALTRRNFPAPVMIEASVPTFNATGQYLIKVVSDSWTGVEQVLPVPFDASLIPKQDVITTELQDLTPLPTSVLQNPDYEQLYSFECFNPIQTQLFHVLYHTDTPVLLGAPTGSGKTIIAEIAMLRMKRLRPESICVYIAPLKALARERLKEWQRRLGSPPLNWKVLELSGDTHHDLNILERSDVLVCTPEKWDLLSRQWRGMNTEDVQKEKSFIKRVGLLVLDEVHLLGEDRGAVLEAIVSRTRFISRYTQQTKESTEKDHNETRIIGLSTALANAVDVADWMGIETQALSPRNKRGLYNFKPSVRPVPVKVHVQGYAGKHYCPRMATMNKPCFAAIKDYSPDKPTLIFVASRRQTRLTAFDLISYAAADEKLTSFLNCGGDYIESVVETISDDSLRHTLAFGIGLHHAGLSSADREKVEKLFLEGKILVLVATATLAWGVNLPAHLVIVKGTEYFDGKLSRYVEYPLTDVLQMIGRAGRVGFGDTSAFAVVMATEDKRIFYGKFLVSI